MRRAKPEKREILPDTRFNSINLQTMVKHVLKSGKKSTAIRLIYTAMDLIKERTEKNPLDVFDAALKNVGPAMEVRPRRVGGATYQVPMEVRPERRQTLGLRWITSYSRARNEETMKERLAAEIIDAINGVGGACKKRDDTHKMAEANKAFAHYRW